MKKRGIGFGSAWQGVNIHFGHEDISTVQIELRQDLNFYVGVAAADLGQGIAETIRAIVAKELGDIPIVNIILLDPDTAVTPDGGATGASRQTFMSGNAALNAAKNMRNLLSKYACEILDTPPSNIIFKDNNFFGNNNSTAPLMEIVDEATKLGQSLIVIGSFTAPKTEPLDDKGQGFGVNQFSYATYIAEVDVDTDTGQVDVLRIDTFVDAGKLIRKIGAEMQVEGGVVMGLGHTLTEEFIQKDGWPLTDSLSTYLIPTIFDVPLEITSTFIEPNPDDNDVVSKGIAELVLVPVAPAIVNAIYDAVGIHITELPATPERILLALNNKNNGEN